MIEIDRLYNTDMFGLIPQIDDGSVDLVICDGPYGVTENAWDQVGSIQEFNLNLIRIFARKLKRGGALYLFGKPDCVDFIDYRPYLNLRAKIVWYQPSRLAQGRRNYTNNYDIICYFIKGTKPKTYNLGAIRVPQLVELEHRLRCERVPSVQQGKFNKTKFNTKGKNPGDVWGDIKQLTYKSKELACRKTLNTIQKPELLLQRLINASSNTNDLILDPFAGTGTALAVCKKLGRHFIGIEKEQFLFDIANSRLENTSLETDNKPETKIQVN
ncbi:MAG: site-specific DNA-methyltransferase [Planctomycetaceae bacterium]|jgi:site-specific DNA-methyltransferase (adenine-specific)/adenine-specific DNA-methyltransferase|nr:site-specific DNA-methyltransferase [Planctomycetaceae bacterium]